MNVAKVHDIIGDDHQPTFLRAYILYLQTLGFWIEHTISSLCAAFTRMFLFSVQGKSVCWNLRTWCYSRSIYWSDLKREEQKMKDFLDKVKNRNLKGNCHSQIIAWDSTHFLSCWGFDYFNVCEFHETLSFHWMNMMAQKGKDGANHKRQIGVPNCSQWELIGDITWHRVHLSPCFAGKSSLNAQPCYCHGWNLSCNRRKCNSLDKHWRKMTSSQHVMVCPILLDCLHDQMVWHSWTHVLYWEPRTGPNWTAEETKWNRQGM